MVSCCSQISSFLPKETSWFFQTSVLHFPKKIINALVTQPSHFSLCQARHFLLTIAHPSSSTAGLLLELSVSLFLQLGHPRRLHDNTCASCSEGEAVHGEHGRAGAGGQRAWEGKEILSSVIFSFWPCFSRDISPVRKYLWSTTCSAFLPSFRRERKQALHCWKVMHLACCLCC